MRNFVSNSQEADQKLLSSVVEFSRSRGAEEAAARFNISVSSIYRYQSELNRKGEISIPRGLNHATRDSIQRGLRALQDEIAAANPATSRSVFEWCLKRMELSSDSQGDFGSLCGRYDSFRLTSIPGDPTAYELVKGQFELSMHQTENYPSFVYSSAEESALHEGREYQCLYTGFVFIVRERIYLFAVGITYGGEYMRPMGFKFGNPRREPLRGMLLGETKPENELMAGRIALYHEHLVDRQELLKGVRNLLSSDFRSPHVLYGGGVHTKVIRKRQPDNALG